MCFISHLYGAVVVVLCCVRAHCTSCLIQISKKYINKINNTVCCLAHVLVMWFSGFVMLLTSDNDRGASTTRDEERAVGLRQQRR